MVLSPGELDILMSVIRICSFLSLIGSFFIICSYYMFRDEHTSKINNLVLYMSGTDFIGSISFIIGTYLPLPTERPYSTSCIVLAIQGTIWILASVFYSSSIAHFIYFSVVKKSEDPPMKAYHFFTWFISILCTLVLYLRQDYGPAGIWCWIPDDRQWDRFFFFYLWIFLCFLFNIFMYVLIIRSARKELSTLSQTHVNNTMYTIKVRLSSYLLAFLLAWFFAVLNRAYQFLHSGSQVYFLFLLEALTNPTWAVFNAIAYGINNNRLISRWKGFVLRIRNRNVEEREYVPL